MRYCAYDNDVLSTHSSGLTCRYMFMQRRNYRNPIRLLYAKTANLQGIVFVLISI